MQSHTPKQNLYARREFLQAVAKRSAVLAGLVAAAHLPYKKPEVQSFFGVKSAYAQATPTSTITTGVILIGPAPPGTVFNSGQDAWEFYCPAGITLDITVNVVELWAEIGLFAPGTTTSDTNLLTGTSAGLASGGVNQSIVTSYGPLATAGNYIIAIEDERVSPETSGTYEIIISSTQPIGPASQIINQGPETLLHDRDV